jgi:hypothetical protein
LPQGSSRRDQGRREGRLTRAASALRSAAHRAGDLIGRLDADGDTRLLSRLIGVGKRYALEVQLDDHLKGRLDLRSLPVGPRRLAFAGLATIALTLLLTVGLYFGASSVAGLAYQDDSGTYFVPIASYWLSAAVYAVG